MAFAEDFATCMSGGGVHVPESTVSDEHSFRAALDYLQSFLASLDPDVREALDAVTTNDAVSVALADSEVGAIHDAYVDLLHAFDAAAGFPLSLCLQWCDHCVEQAAAAAAN